MQAITYKEFGGGLDRRLPIGVQDANRLWTLKNAYITSGKKISKRPALRAVTTGLSGSVGLTAIGGGLQVFAQVGAGYVPPSGVGVLELDGYSLGGPTELVGVLYAKLFQGYPYVVGLHRTLAARPDPPPGQVATPGLIERDLPRHHYLDGGGSTLITDANCSHGYSATAAASRIFTEGDQVVRYCAAGDARDWTTASDAGFLSASLQQDTKDSPTAVGTFADALVVGFSDGMQIWDVAVDMSAAAIRSHHYGAGTAHPQSMAAFFRDLVFVSPYGVRSMSVQETVDRMDETDVGVPIDSLVTPALKAHEAASRQRVIGVWLQQLGQYWLVFDAGGGTSRVFAYSFSRSAKLACWSEYTFPVLLTGITALAGKVYARSDSTLYELGATQFTDDGDPVDVDVQMAYQDAKLPGVEKMFAGADYVFSGTPSVSYLYDPRDQAMETIAQEIAGDTRAGTMIPVEVSSAAIAPRFQHSADEAFSLDMATLYFHSLSATSG